MSHHFKVGDLALIVGCNKNPVNIGRQVELALRVDHTDLFECSGITWQMQTPETTWIVKANNIIRAHGEALVDGEYTACLERHLRPLRGDFTPEEEREEQEIEA